MRKIEKVVLIEPKSPGPHVFSYARLPRLGLPLIGAILREQGYQVKIFCEEIAPIDWAEVLRADLVGISSITPTAPRAYQIVKRVKEKKEDTPVVMGGPHVTFLPEEALREGVDYVVRGEGEETIVELVEWLEGSGSLDISEISGLSYREGNEVKHNPDRSLIQDLNSLPFPDLTLIEGFKRISTIPIQTSRGCPYNCKFCQVTKMFGRKYRFRSAESVIEELRRLYDQIDVGHVFFYDDNFSADPKRTKDLLQVMGEEGITSPWSAQERVSVVKDLELLQLMKRSNCSRLYLGLESVNPQTLKDYRKGQTVEEIDKAIRTLHQHGIRVHGMFVLGGDPDTISTVKETVGYSLRTKIDTVQFLILTPAPGTETYQELDAAGRIFTKRWELYDGHHVVFRPKLMSPWQLQAAVTLEAMPRFYSYLHGVGSMITGKFRNSFFAFYGHRVIKRWKAQNEDFLTWLRRFERRNLKEKGEAPTG